MRYSIAFLLVIGTVLASCQYENEEDLYPIKPETCDTANVSYKLDIEPIMKSKCYQCHSAVNNRTFARGNNLEGYTNVKAKIDLGLGLILGNIKHEPGFQPMPGPANASKLPECEILKFEAWIKKGAPNN